MCIRDRYGDDKTSAQLALDALVLIDIDMNGVLVLTLIAGFLSVLAMTAFTLWLSARMRSSVAVLAVALAVAMTPTFLVILLRESALGDWLRLIPVSYTHLDVYKRQGLLYITLNRPVSQYYLAAWQNFWYTYIKEGGMT